MMALISAPDNQSSASSWPGATTIPSQSGPPMPTNPEHIEEMIITDEAKMMSQTELETEGVE
jgi:hypothetical protein